MSATCDRRTGCAPMVLDPRRATISVPKSSGRFTRPSICTRRSDSRERSEPAGRFWFSLRTAAITWSTPTPKASMASGLR